MRRSWLIWLGFSICVGFAAWAMARVGSTALALERAEAEARRRTALEENLQLALWRMDSALAPLIAEESSRPYFAYSPFYPAERAYTSMFAEIQKGDVLVPSPLLTYAGGYVRLHFQFGPDGRLISPQVPTGNMRDLAEGRYVTYEQLEQSISHLTELGKLLNRKTLAFALGPDQPSRSGTMASAVQAQQNTQVTWDEESQNVKASNEYMKRSQGARRAQTMNSAIQTNNLKAFSTPVDQGFLQAVWVGPVLVLARRVRVEEGIFLQGCWLDWDVIRKELLESIADLLPDPKLEPVSLPARSDNPTRMLAAIPVRLVPGIAHPPVESSLSPVRLSLWIAWACLGLAASAIALLLRGVISLSERRGTFVSAVTHELRTPMTTFRLYTEMLTEGMVEDAEARQSYLRTLRSEAERLGHLVENVLAFARLERGRAVDRRETVSPAQLLAQVEPQLEARARQSGMTLEFENGTPPGTRLRTDMSVIAQILVNLVDNAAKYARSASDRRIHLETRTDGVRLEIAVRDHGPGISTNGSRRLFRPFSKSASDAAATAPGVGLGLALSRRLACDLGGELRLCRSSEPGACFCLTLPLET